MSPESPHPSSSLLSSSGLSFRRFHSVVAVPLASTHSARSLDGLWRALHQGSSAADSEGTDNESSRERMVPHSALTRPGDWKYEATPWKAFHWQYGAQRLRFVRGDTTTTTTSASLLQQQQQRKNEAWADLQPQMRTAAVLGVLNVHDCSVEGGGGAGSIVVRRGTSSSTLFMERVQRACRELQEWAAAYAQRNGDTPVTRLLVFDSFDMQEEMDLSQWPLDRHTIIAFPPTTQQGDDPRLTLHLNWVISDVVVAIFRDLERQVQPFVLRALAEPATTLEATGGLTRRSLARLVSSTATSTTSTSNASDEDAVSTATQQPPPTVDASTPSAASLFPSPLALRTPLDDAFPPLIGGDAKDVEALRKRDQGRREKWMGDLALLVGSPMDAYEHYLKAMDVGKGGADPLWYASALEGCAAAHLAMADIGGYGVDEYLENHFSLPEEIMALARDDAKKTSGGGGKQTLPEVVFVLCEEALQILSRHEKLGILYVELLLKLAQYCAEDAESHLRCRWGEGPYGYAGESGEVPRWERTSVSQMKFHPLKTKEGGHSMIAINTHNRIKKFCELLSVAVAVGSLDALTRMDVARRCAQMCLTGVKVGCFGTLSLLSKFGTHGSSFMEI